MTDKRVAITGIGAVTPVGNDREATWGSLVAGRNGVSTITTFDASTFPVRIAGMVKDFDISRRVPDRRLQRYLTRQGGFGVSAALEALEVAGDTDAVYAPEERGIAMGGGVGRPALEDLVEIMQTRQESDGHRLQRQSPQVVVQNAQGTPVAIMAMLGRCDGPPVAINTACAASSHSIGEAYRLIQAGAARLMVAGGYDSLTTYIDVLGFGLLGALTDSHNEDAEHASMPFDRERAGFVLGEGAVAVVLEELGAARSRGAHIYAELCGYGASMNAYRITDAPPDGGGPIQAMRRALAESGLGPDGVDYLVAHGTSTPGNDISETMAIKAVFGEAAYRLAVSSPKSMTGHLTAAAGALNVLVAACSIRDQVAPPTINLRHPDPKLDLDYVPNEAREMRIRAVMVDAFAFGGVNAALVVKEAA